MGGLPTFQSLIPEFTASSGVYWAAQIGGWIFAIGIAVSVVSFVLSLLFILIGTISMGNLAMWDRSRFWFSFGISWFGITGFIWGLTRVVVLIFGT